MEQHKNSSLHFLASMLQGTFFLLAGRLRRDQLSRLLCGGQISLFAGLLGAGITLSLACSWGESAGYFGSWVTMSSCAAQKSSWPCPGSTCSLPFAPFCRLHLGARQTFFFWSAYRAYGLGASVAFDSRRCSQREAARLRSRGRGSARPGATFCAVTCSRRLSP